MWRHNKTEFILPVIFLGLLSLSIHILPSITIYLLVNQLAELGLLFMLVFLLARHWRLKTGNSAKLYPWRLLLITSLVVWIIGIFIQGMIVNQRSLLSWQLVVVGAAVFGVYNPEVSSWWQHFNSRTRWLLVSTLAAATMIALCLNAFIVQHENLIPIGNLLFDYTTLGPLMVLLFCAWLPLVYHILHHLENMIFSTKTNKP